MNIRPFHGREPVLEEGVDDASGEQWQHFEDAGERRDRMRVAPQAQEQQILRAMRMESSLGVEHQVHAR